jgi:hypothetical protein
MDLISVFNKKNGLKLAKSIKTQYDTESELAVTHLVSVETVRSLLLFSFKG